MFEYRVCDLLINPYGQVYKTFTTEKAAREYMVKELRKWKDKATQDNGIFTQWTTRSVRAWTNWYDRIVLFLTLEIHLVG